MDDFKTGAKDAVENSGGFSPETRLNLLDESRFLSLSKADTVDFLPNVEIFDADNPKGLPRLPQLKDVIEHLERVPPPQGPPPPPGSRQSPELPFEPEPKEN